MLTTYQKQVKIKLTTTIITIVVVAGVIVLINHLNRKSAAVASNLNQSSSASVTTTPVTTPSTADSTSTTPSTTTQPATTPTAPATNTSGYKDGTYTATNSYFVPHGEETIRVTLTLSNGVVTGSTVQNSESDPDSARFQESFAAEYKSVVVGRKISSLQVGAIGGASDTAQGFNDAVSQIASQAQA